MAFATLEASLFCLYTLEYEAVLAATQFDDGPPYLQLTGLAHCFVQAALIASGSLQYGQSPIAALPAIQIILLLPASVLNPVLPARPAYLPALYSRADNARYVKLAGFLQLRRGLPARIRAARRTRRMHKPEIRPRPQHLVVLPPAGATASYGWNEYPDLRYSVPKARRKALFSALPGTR